MITKADLDAMSPEELEAFKAEASVRVFKRLLGFAAFKIALLVSLRLLAKRVSS